MNGHEGAGEVIEPLRAGAHEDGGRDELGQGADGSVVIDPLRAPARDLHAEWRADATKTPGQLVAEGVDRKEATRRVRWARRQLKREAEMAAFLEELDARRAARKTAAGRTLPLQTTTNNDQEVKS